MSAQLRPRLIKQPCIKSSRSFERIVFVGDPFDLLEHILGLKRTGKISINVLQGNAASVEWESHASVD